MAWTVRGRLEAEHARHAYLGECRVEVYFQQKSPQPLGNGADGASNGGGAAGGTATRRTGGRSAAATKRAGRTAVVEEPEPIVMPARVAARTDADGAFELTLPDKDTLASKKLHVVVSAPSGATIADESMSADDLKDGVVISVEGVEQITLDQPEEPPKPATYHITGRVIERHGRPLPASSQVLIYARKKGERGEKFTGKDAPLLAVHIDATGYFLGDIPNEPVEAAAALVSGISGEIAIAVEEGLIPKRLALMVDMPDVVTPPVPTGDCGCKDVKTPPRTPSHDDLTNASDLYSSDLGTGGCVQFNTPNRAIEEFDFFTVIRTTEPEIRGYTLDDPSLAPITDEPAPPERGAARRRREPAAATMTNVIRDERISRLGLKFGAGIGVERRPGRAQLDGDNPMDWDSSPTFYEATTVAHGHLLHFKQTWYADGYSLGDLLYSLPLAPGQKKLISVTDWERRERTARDEQTFGTEDVTASLQRDRDLSEVVTGALSESVRGGSKNTTVGVGAGTGAAGNGSYEGFNFGALLGVSGGYGESDSNAWQDSARNLTSSSLQGLRDRTMQSASAVRGLRSSVVQTVSQGESTRVTTEVVANHNHCHALTIQYFEVLRHLKLEHDIVDVQECLFVPLLMSQFDAPKALRWRQSLQTYLQRPDLATAFDALRRVQTNWGEADYPAARYADEKILSIAGEMQVTIVIPLPPMPDRPKPRPEDTLKDTADAIQQATAPTTGFLGVLSAVLTGGASLVVGAAVGAATDATKAAISGVQALADDLYAQPTPQERYDKFQHDVMPGVAAGFIDQLELWALVNGNNVQLSAADFTLVSDYQPGVPLLVSVRANLPPNIKRSDVQEVIIKSSVGLPSGCRVIVNAATMRYRTRLFEHPLLDDRRANDDIDLPKVAPLFTPPFDFSVQQTAPGKGAELDTPIDAWEQRSPRTEDRRMAAELIDHLNANLEYYHHSVWWTMDPNRRYMLLDGYYAPGSNDRSIASVVENRLIGIVGNSLVLPVARGNHLDPRFSSNGNTSKASLIDFYKTSVPPARVSLPTKGVFAEAVMGQCNACEQIDDSKFWRWEESPIDEPPAIEPASTATRRTEPADVQPTPFPTPIVSIQSAPAAPDPTGVAAALNALTKQSFADITGLAGTQANAAAAYSKAVDTALAFGKEASTLAQQAAMLGAKDKTMNAIDSAESSGKIDSKDAKDLRVKALKKMVGDTTADPKASSVADRLKVIDDQVAKGSITKEQGAARAEEVMKALNPDDSQVQAGQQAATETIKNIPPEQVESVETTDPSGATTSVKARPAGSEDDGSGSSGGGGGFLSSMVSDILAAQPDAMRSPLIAFDPSNPTDASSDAYFRMEIVDATGTQLNDRMKKYIDAFGFDKTEDPVIQGPQIRQPSTGMTQADLDAVIAVANALGVEPATVLAVWISEGKLPKNSFLHGGWTDWVVEKANISGATTGQVLSFARSIPLYTTFGADSMTAIAPHALPNGDNDLLGPKANHDKAFNQSLDAIRAAGVQGFSARTNDDIRDYFTKVGGGLIVKRIQSAAADTIRVRLTGNSLASWLWLQAAFFEATRVKLQGEFKRIYGTTIDLTDRPWVTYLWWNTNKTSDVVDRYYGKHGTVQTAEAAIAERFGSDTKAPAKFDKATLDRYYHRSDPQGQSTAAWPNAVMVKFLVESVAPWFE